MSRGGLHKLVEESGELQQVVGKILAYPEGEHPDGAGNLRSRMQEELADVLACCAFVIEKMDLNAEFINKRKWQKISKYKKWDAE